MLKDKIAVIGMSNVFPGSTDPAEFWQQLLEKQQFKTDVTTDDMEAEPAAFAGKPNESDKFYCLKGGYVRDFEFDAQGFYVDNEELVGLDKLFQLALTASRNALQSGGYWGREQLNTTGVLLGNLSFPTRHSNHLFLPLYQQAYQAALNEAGLPLSLQPFAENKTVSFDNAAIAGLPASIIAGACGLKGVHYALDAACASSCYAVQLAGYYLQTGQADMMLAGAVSAADPMFIHMGFSIFHAYPENQIHAPLDTNSQGLFAGEGAGMLLLKRLSDAKRDGDTIHAVIEGGGLSNDGAGEFVLSPNSKGQVLAFERAYQEANIQPNEVDYVECHATGTPKGDQVELKSMEAFFDGHKPRIGSVKSNLGHLLTAAGMPSMTKAITALNEGVIPATVNVQSAMSTPSGFGGDQIVTDTIAWPESNHARTAGVSVFGFGGSNAHLVLRQGDQASESRQQLKEPCPLSIVGVDVHVGTAENFDDFSGKLNAGEHCFQALPEKRWKGFEQVPELLEMAGFSQAPEGAFIDEFDLDFLRFKIPPNPDDELIPQQLLLMKVADNAAQMAELQKGQNVAVITAMGIEQELHQYRGRVNLSTQIEASLAAQGIQLNDDERSQLIGSLKDSLAGAAGLNQYTSFIGNIMAARVSALWDFSGPAFTLSAEEQSVYRALELAQTLFQTSDVEAVIIAAVDLAGSFENAVARKGQVGVQLADGAGAIVVKRADVSEGFATIEGLELAEGKSLDAIQTAAALSFHQTDNSVDWVDLALTAKTDEIAPQAELFSALYPQAHISASQAQTGALFHASGLIQLIAGLAAIKSGKAQHYAMTTQSLDNKTSHIRLKKAQGGFKSLPTPQGKQLIRPIQLGGDPLVAKFNELIKPYKASLQQKIKTMTVKTDTVSTNNVGRDSEASPATQKSLVNFNQLLAAQAETHQAFLDTRLHTQRQISALITGGNIETAPAGDALLSRPTDLCLPERFTVPKQVIFDQADLVEFAEGEIGNVFGEDYRIIDNYSRRVRLPTSDYLLVTRVTDLEAETHAYKPSYMATEYDIPVDAPFLVDGQIPWSVAVESGQCDLMLISYIGIDFKAKGERVYRLLDCELTFLEDIAFGGQTLRYEIQIDSYAKNGDQLLFFFHYDCFVDGKKVLIMRGGCAGFFTDEELDEGKGVILTDADKDELATAEKSYFVPLITNERTHYQYDDMMKLVRGDIAGCFGAAYEQGGRNPSLQFSSEKFLMIEEVQSIDPTGGHWGLGLLVGRKRLEPDHWYFPCHFKDDQVMAGSLMSEGCGQLAMFFMLWLGMHKDMTNARFQPVHGASQKVRCRGQVTPQSNELIYRLEVTKISMSPNPMLHANIDIILDGKVVVDFKNLAVQIKEQDAASPYARQLLNQPVQTQPVQTKAPVLAINTPLDETGKAAFANVNAPLMWVETDTAAAPIKGVKPIKHVEAPVAPNQNRVPDTVPFTPWHLFEFATGDIAKCFGDEFKVYHGRIPPRTPCGDLQLVTEVVDVQGARHDLKKPSSCIAHYEVPEDAWYFSKNSHPSYMPYSIMMEIALQPNGFISGFMGTTLAYPEKDLFFRNLDGKGHFMRDIDLRGKTIENRSVMLSTSMAGGSIIQSFTFDLLADGETFYKGTAVFGYFSDHALTHQLGIDNGALTDPWFEGKNVEKIVVDLRDKALPLFSVTPDKPHYHLCDGQLNFLDTVTMCEKGGDHGQGYLLGERTIDASDWFFRYHFHQDPVMPGSLGVEAMIESLKVFAMQQGLGDKFANPRFDTPKTEVTWKYRGQITPHNKTMTVDVHIVSIEHQGLETRIIAEANLYKDSLRIYQVKDLCLSIVECGD